MITANWLNAFEQCLDEDQHHGCASHDGEICDCGVHDTRELVAAYREMKAERDAAVESESALVPAYRDMRAERDALTKRWDALAVWLITDAPEPVEVDVRRKMRELEAGR